MRKCAYVATSVVVASLVGAASAHATQLTAIGLGAVAVAGLIAMRPQWTIYATIVFAYTAVPDFLPRSVAVLGLNAFLYEISLVLAAIVVTRKEYRGDIKAASRTYGLLAIVVLGGAIALRNGLAPNRMINDARGLIVMALGVWVASRVINTPAAKGATNALRISLWISATLIATAPFTAIELTGRSEDASLSFGDSASRATTGAERYLTSATHVSLAVVCVVLVLCVGRGVKFKSTLSFFIPAIAVVFFSFSRNSILVVGVALAFALIIEGSMAKAVRALGYTSATLATLGLIAWIAAASIDVPLLAYLHTQISGYTDRVLEGFSRQALSSDTSARFRAEENVYLIRAFQNAPVVGHGLGYPFRPIAGSADGYLATAGAYYAHNFYYWLAAKSGIAGVLIYLWVVIPPILKTTRQASGALIASSATLAGFLVGSFVAPFPLGSESGSSLLMGVLVASALATQPREKYRGNSSTECPAVEGEHDRMILTTLGSNRGS